MSTITSATQSIIGEPEVVEDASIAEHSAAWTLLKDAAIAMRPLQIKDGSIPNADDREAAAGHVAAIISGIRALAPAFPHDAAYLDALVVDFQRWADDGFGVPDFLDSLVAFQPQQHRIDGIRHLVVFPMYTQNGSSDLLVEALIVETIWPEFIAELEAGDYGNKLFVSLRLVDFTPGYDTNSAVLFPETVAMREIPSFTWGAIFQDREAARYRPRARSIRDHQPRPARAREGDARRPADDREDVRDVGHHPRPHPHAWGPAVRSVHDQAADAVLPLLARGDALRHDRVPRVGEDRARVRRPHRRR